MRRRKRLKSCKFRFNIRMAGAFSGALPVNGAPCGSATHGGGHRASLA